MNCNDAIWYYRLGGQTLGPVSWMEIEQLTRDTIDAKDLLVARGGDAGWQLAADVPDEHPELAAAATGVVEEWELPEEPDEPAPTPAAWEPAAPEPSAAASEVLGVAAVTRATGRAVPSMPREPGAWSPNEMPRKHGLGAWIGQAWEMVINDIWAWVGALLLMMLVVSVTLGITGPPLTVGLYMMALKRYRGEKIGAGNIFDGFSRFASSWGVALLMAIPSVILMAPMMILFAIPAMQAQGGGNVEDIAAGVTVAAYVMMPILWLLVMVVTTVFFYSWPLVADGYRVWESVTMSWEKVRQSFWSYLGTWLVLTILSSLGSYACYVGWFLTYPLLPCAQVAAYMWHFRRA